MDRRDQQRIDVLTRWREGALAVSEATALLGCSGRTAWRLRGRFRRVVGNDNTVRVEGVILQLPPTHGGRGLTGRRVEVELRLDGRVAAPSGPATHLVPTTPGTDRDQRRPAAPD